MKKYVTSALLVLAAAAVMAQPRETTSFTAPMRPKQAKATKPPPLQPQQTRGVLVRAFGRGNNPLQMVNPKANPAKYGTSQEAIVFEAIPVTTAVAQNGQTDAGKWKGIKFFVFRF